MYHCIKNIHHLHICSVFKIEVLYTYTENLSCLSSFISYKRFPKELLQSWAINCLNCQLQKLSKSSMLSKNTSPKFYPKYCPKCCPIALQYAVQKNKTQSQGRKNNKQNYKLKVFFFFFLFSSDIHDFPFVIVPTTLKTVFEEHMTSLT